MAGVSKAKRDPTHNSGWLCSMLGANRSRRAVDGLKGKSRCAEIRNTMQTHGDPRIKKRLPCTLDHADRHQRGLILNLSSAGLFVQTNLPAEPGSLVGIGFQHPDVDDSIAIKAAVVWRRRVSSRMIGVTQSGMGVRILEQPRAYDEFVTSIISEEAPSAGPATHSPVRESTDSASPSPPPETLHRYVVRVGQSGGPRSRRLILHCPSIADARAEALLEAGTNWSILEIVEE
jgi:hypothetical protein